MKTHMNRFVMVLGIGMIMSLAGTEAYGANVDLTGNNVDINLEASWTAGSPPNRMAIASGNTGYLDSVYTDIGATNKPAANDYWTVNAGHLVLNSGASLSYDSDLKITHGSDENGATITLNAGSFFENTKEDDNFGVSIGYEAAKRGTFIVNNGGTVGAKTDVYLGGSVAGLAGASQDNFGVFRVIGDGGSINTDQFSISRFARVEFVLGGPTAISTINVGGDLTIYTDDDDSDTKFKKHQQRVDKMFSAKDNARTQNRDIDE